MWHNWNCCSGLCLARLLCSKQHCRSFPRRTTKKSWLITFRVHLDNQHQPWWTSNAFLWHCCQYFVHLKKWIRHLLPSRVRNWPCPHGPTGSQSKYYNRMDIEDCQTSQEWTIRGSCTESRMPPAKSDSSDRVHLISHMMLSVAH